MAAESNMVAKLTLRLKDELTSGLDRLRGRLDRLSAATRGIALIGTAFAAISLAGPISQAAAFDSQLRDIAITAGRSGRAVEDMIARQRTAFETLALASGQSSTAVAGGAGLLAAAGMDPAQAEALLPIIARVATASGAAMNDIAQTAFSLSDALQVPADQMPNALAGLIMAGKEGRFELAAMAREFPGLTAAANALGMRGTSAVNSLSAALQIARKGAASESEAANNLANFMGKLSSPETVRNFEKMGVDWAKFMQSVRTQGLNPIEAAIQKIRTLTAGDPLKLGQLFGDKQVLDFLQPILANVPEYLRIRNAAAGAGTDLIDTDFASRMAGLEAPLKRSSELVAQIQRRIGLAFSAAVPALLPGLESLREWITWMDTAAPGSLDLVLQIAAGITMLVTALAVLGPVASAVAGGFAVLSAGFGLVGAGLAAIATPIAAVVAGVLLAAAVIGGAAYVIWRDWERYGPMFRKLWDGIKATFRGAIDFIAGIFTQDSARARAGVAAAWQGIGAAFRAIWGVVRTLFTDFIGWVSGWATGGPVGAALGAIQSAWQGLSSRFAVIWQDVKGSFGEFATWVVSWAAGPTTTAIDAIKGAWNGLTGWFSSLIQGWRQPFDDFLNGIERRLQPLRDVAEQVGRLMGRGGPAPATAGGAPGEAEIPALTPEQRRFNWRDRGALGGFPTPQAAAAPARTDIQVTVAAEAGAEVTDVRSNNPDTRIRTVGPDRGRTVGRP